MFICFLKQQLVLARINHVIYLSNHSSCLQKQMNIESLYTCVVLWQSEGGEPSLDMLFLWIGEILPGKVTLLCDLHISIAL